MTCLLLRALAVAAAAASAEGALTLGGTTSAVVHHFYTGAHIGGDAIAIGVTLAVDASETIGSATVTVDGDGTVALEKADGDTVLGAWDASSGALTLTGSASAAVYQALLRRVTYEANSDALLAAGTIAATRTLSVVATSTGSVASNTLTLTVNLRRAERAYTDYYGGTVECDGLECGVSSDAAITVLEIPAQHPGSS